MNWLNIVTSVVSSLPSLSTVINDVVKALQVQTSPVVTPVGNTPIKPSETVKTLQRLLNQFVQPNPPLQEDGWLGPKTEAAINQAIQMAKPYLSMFGIKI